MAGYAPPLVLSNNPQTRQQGVAAGNAAPSGTLLHAALVVAGLTEDDAPPPVPAHRGGRSTRAIQVRPPMGAAMAAVHANFFAEDAAAPSNAHAATVLYRDLEGTNNGMPLDEWGIYYGVNVPVNGVPTQLAVQDLFRAVVLARGPLAQNRRIRMRIDFWYTTRSVVARPSYDPPTAYVGLRLMHVPRLVIGSRTVVEGTDASIRARVRAALVNFNAILSDQQPGDSDRVPDRVICAQVWAVPSMTGRGVGSLGRLGFVDTEEEAKALGEVPLPKALHQCRGLVINFPEKKDTLCVARAIMTALDPFLEASSDANWVNLLTDAHRGAAAALLAARSKASATATPGIAHSRSLRLTEAEATVNRLTEELKRAIAITEASGRRVRKATERPDVYRATNRYRTIEKELVRAFKGEHPLVTFTDPFFSSNPPINEDTLVKLRSCIKPGVAIKIQIWGISINDKIGLVYPDPGATLEFVANGGRVLNILVAYQHASFVRDVGACCNRASDGGKYRGRFYCSLCGHSVSIGTAGYQLKMHHHQVAACASGRRFSFPAPLSSTNRCQLKQHDLSAKERTLLTAVLETDALFVAARLPLSWASIQDVAWWEDLHRRFLHGTTADISTISLPPTAKDWRVAVATEDTITLTPSIEQSFSFLTQPSTVTRLLAHLHWECPKDHISSRVAQTEPSCCIGCHRPVWKPSLWKEQSAEAPCEPFVEAEDDASDGEQSESEDETQEPPLEHTAEPFVVHHCHATGLCAAAHVDCNACIRQSVSRLHIETTSLAVLAKVATLACTRSFVEEVCEGRLPRIAIREGRIRSVTLKVAGLPRADKTRTLVVPYLTLTFRSPDAMLPQYDAADGIFIEQLIRTAEANFAATHLWMPSFHTSISYARGVLHDYAARGGYYATSIVSADSFASAKRITPGGILLLGERVESSPLSDAEREYKGRFYFDINSSYPVQLQRWALPLYEHLDRRTHDFSSDLAKGIEFIRTTSLEGDNVERVEISGYWPDELHADLKAFPPVFQRIAVVPAMLSRFQRVHMGLHMDDAPQMRSVGHLLPVDGAVVFLRMAKLWQRLGMVFTKIGVVWSTPAEFWGREFSKDMEAKRRAAAAAGDKATVAAVKQVCNSVIGSLNVDASKFTTILPHKAYEEEAEHKMTTSEKFADNPRFTLRSWSLGDCTLYELEQARVVHKQQTLAALFIQVMAQCDLLELWYGGGRFVKIGIKKLLDNPVILYGNTDSLFIEVTCPPCPPHQRDIRGCVADRLYGLLDLSNVPASSTFWKSCEYYPRASDTAGKWGMLKEETGFAGIEAMVVNGPNRYGFRILQSDTDTLPEHRGNGKDVLKSLPRAWKNAEDAPTLEDFWASWLCEEERPPPLHPIRILRSAGDNIGDLVEVELSRARVSPWGNAHCIVSRTAPYPQWPIGCKLPEAVACVNGTAW